MSVMLIRATCTLTYETRCGDFDVIDCSFEMGYLDGFDYS